MTSLARWGVWPLVVTIQLGCADGSSGFDICDELTCDDSNECTVDTCDSAHPRVCVFTSAPANTPCNGVGVCDGMGECVDCGADDQCGDDYNDCTVPSCEEGACGSSPIFDGSSCVGGTCRAGQCALSVSHLPCTEQGVRNAIGAGGGPFTFDCDGPTIVPTQAEIVIATDVALDGSGLLTLSGGGDHRVFSVLLGAVVEIRGFTVTRGVATRAIDTANCGGITNGGTLTLADSFIIGNVAAHGGGGLCNNNGRLTLVRTNVWANTAQACGGIFNNGVLELEHSQVSTNQATAGGGGICNSGILTLRGSTVSANSAAYAGGIESSGTLVLLNSTLSGNASQQWAAAFFNTGGAVVTHGTLSGNAAGENGSDIRNLGTLTFARSLVDGDCVGEVESIESGGYNIQSPGRSCGFDERGDLLDVSSLEIGPLTNNGGPTLTHALQPDSVAVDRIPSSECNITHDQRGVARPQGDACDVGAFELE